MICEKCFDIWIWARILAKLMLPIEAEKETNRLRNMKLEDVNSQLIKL